MSGIFFLQRIDTSKTIFNVGMRRLLTNNDKFVNGGGMKTKKIIFLDIDGVMNSKESMEENGGPDSEFQDMPGKTHIAALNKIIKATGAEIVISSCWRYHSDYVMFGWFFHALGIKGNVIGTTPKLKPEDFEMTCIPRGLEIKTWMEAFLKSHVSYNNIKFIILDDDSDMCELTDHLVQTDWEIGKLGGGLTDEHVPQAIKTIKNGAPFKLV